MFALVGCCGQCVYKMNVYELNNLRDTWIFDRTVVWRTSSIYYWVSLTKIDDQAVRVRANSTPFSKSIKVPVLLWVKTPDGQHHIDERLFEKVLATWKNTFGESFGRPFQPLHVHFEQFSLQTKYLTLPPKVCSSYSGHKVKSSL